MTPSHRHEADVPRRLQAPTLHHPGLRLLRPVLLREADFATWLSGEACPDVLQPAAESALREWTVDRRVNRTGEGDDDPTIVERVASAAA